MTFTSLDAAFQSLPESSQNRLLDVRVEMCIFDQRQLEAYDTACLTCAHRHG